MYVCMYACVCLSVCLSKCVCVCVCVRVCRRIGPVPISSLPPPPPPTPATALVLLSGGSGSIARMQSNPHLDLNINHTSCLGGGDGGRRRCLPFSREFFFGDSTSAAAARPGPGRADSLSHLSEAAAKRRALEEAAAERILEHVEVGEKVGEEEGGHEQGEAAPSLPIPPTPPLFPSSQGVAFSSYNGSWASNEHHDHPQPQHDQPHQQQQQRRRERREREEARHQRAKQMALALREQLAQITLLAETLQALVSPLVP